MKQFSLYDIVGVLAPGTVIVVGFSVLYPRLSGPLMNSNLSGGELGLLVLLSYVVGNIVAGLSNILERPYWALTGGIHTARAQNNDGKVLTANEFERLQTKLRETGIVKDTETIRELDAKRWWAITRQINAFLDGRKLADRVQLFNAQFGMNRGIATAFLIILTMTIVRLGIQAWKVELLLAGSSAVSVYRMHTFSLHYAQTLFRMFLTAPEKTPSPPTSATDD
jgi:hypothetical protein